MVRILVDLLHLHWLVVDGLCFLIRKLWQLRAIDLVVGWAWRRRRLFIGLHFHHPGFCPRGVMSDGIQRRLHLIADHLGSGNALCLEIIFCACICGRAAAIFVMIS